MITRMRFSFRGKAMSGKFNELRIAFQIGFMLYMPMLLVDMVVAAVLMSMGMMMLPPVMISMPFKILLFVLIDGWYLVVESIIGGLR